MTNQTPQVSMPSASELDRLRSVEQELKDRLRQQAAVAHLGQQALAGSDLHALMETTTALVAEILGVDFCKILELLPGGQDLLLKAGVGWQAGYVGRATVSAGGNSQAGYTLSTNEPVIVADLPTETRFSGPPLLKDHHVVSGVSVIIPGKEQPYGVLGVHTTRPREFTSYDAHFLQSVANLLASAVGRLRMESELRSSRDQFSIILQGVADGITAQDPTGRLIYANDAAARIIGFLDGTQLVKAPLEEVVGKFDIFNEQDEPFPIDKLPGRLALQGIQSPPATVRFRVKSTGEEHWSIVKATPVMNASGGVALAVNIFQDVTELKRIEQSQRMLAEAGSLLAASLDYAATLNSVAQLAVTRLADWCSVHVVDEVGSIQQIAVAHVDPQKVMLAREFNQRFPPDYESPDGVAGVIHSGKPEFYPEITDAMIEAGARDEEHLDLIRSLRLKSFIILPLVARGRTLGAMTLVWAESNRRYTSNDVILAEELARRAALAIDNARLFQQAQALNAELEAGVNRRTVQLQTLVTKLHSEIAERKKAEELLISSEQILQTLFESAPDALILVDADGRIVRVNQQAQTIFGYPNSELVGTPVDRLLPERFQHQHTRHRSNYLSGPRTRPMGAGLELFGQRKDGSEFPVDIMLSPIQMEENRLVIAAVRDISESKQMQAELTEVQRRLFESVEAERLHIAQELHDGPIQDLYSLTYQLSSLESLEIPDDELAPIFRQELQSSRETAKGVINLLRSMIGDLRPPALAPFGLEKAINAHSDHTAETHPELSFRLELQPDGQILPERTRLALFRIYQNAISNVIRHANATQVYIRFTFDDHQAVLEISDNGCGFNVPTRWVELTRNGHFGLAGTHERVQAVSGQMEITSAPGQGTIIRVIVPIQRLQKETLS